MNIRWSIAEVASFGLTVASLTAAIVVWTHSNFQLKADAVLLKQDVDQKIARLESDLASVRNSTFQIGVDVSYIRGRLEPRK